MKDFTLEKTFENCLTNIKSNSIIDHEDCIFKTCCKKYKKKEKKRCKSCPKK